MSRKRERYQCCICGHIWEQERRAFYSRFSGHLIGYTTAAECPNCGALHVHWLTFMEGMQNDRE